MPPFGGLVFHLLFIDNANDLERLAELQFHCDLAIPDS